MLELRPVCENCRKPMPPDARDAKICSFECTFCADCVDNVLGNVCPNCGGGFCPRPVRPKREWRAGESLTHYPPTDKVRHRPVDVREHAEFAARVSAVDPSAR